MKLFSAYILCAIISLSSLLVANEKVTEINAVQLNDKEFLNQLYEEYLHTLPVIQRRGDFYVYENFQDEGFTPEEVELSKEMFITLGIGEKDEDFTFPEDGSMMIKSVDVISFTDEDLANCTDCKEDCIDCEDCLQKKGHHHKKHSKKEDTAACIFGCGITSSLLPLYFSKYPAPIRRCSEGLALVLNAKCLQCCKMGIKHCKKAFIKKMTHYYRTVEYWFAGKTRNDVNSDGKVIERKRNTKEQQENLGDKKQMIKVFG